jgi:hypothetical protein
MLGLTQPLCHKEAYDYNLAVLIHLSQSLLMRWGIAPLLSIPLFQFR